ncbi:MAG TPA: GNAT family N-acetyltransferase [Bellilinea sp.]|nr:GNAT family N-acetyltransferase [Bellilinea sp.]
MHVEIIDNFQDFTQVKVNWDAVYEADPEAQFFLSWTWMSKWLEWIEDQWFILAAKPKANAPAYVAFLPLRLRTEMRKGGGFYNEINMAGRPAADYTGLICAPEFQSDATPALAKYIQHLNWAILDFEYTRLSEEPMRLFLSSFTRQELEIKIIENSCNDAIDLCICPYIRLPKDWDTYLSKNISPNTRQKIRRFLRKTENSGEFRITHANADTISRDLEILLRFWGLKWGSRKGKGSRRIQERTRVMLMHCFDHGSLFLPVLWKGDAPLGALAILVDTAKRSLLFRIGGRDETFNDLPPGFVLHAYSIRYAINNGFMVYDFLRGNEPYKFSFSSDERRIKHILMRTKDGKNLGNRLDSRSLPVALQLAKKLHRGGRLAEARLGYQQILELEPQCPSALYGLGNIMAKEGDYDSAEQLFKVLVAVEPDSYIAWIRLGDALAAQSRFPAATDAYCEAIRRRPESPAAYNELGHAWLGLG